MVKYEPSDIFKKGKNNIEERILNWKFCVVSGLDDVLLKHTRSFILQVVKECPLSSFKKLFNESV